jgi:capsular polysaccharide biosynthesis protein
MNKGDKLVCIEDFQIVLITNIYVYKVGDIVEIYDVHKEYESAYPVRVKKNNGDKNNFTYEEIKKYFILLYEWRNQQIDKILEDE